MVKNTSLLKSVVLNWLFCFSRLSQRLTYICEKRTLLSALPILLTGINPLVYNISFVLFVALAILIAPFSVICNMSFAIIVENLSFPSSLSSLEVFDIIAHNYAGGCNELTSSEKKGKRRRLGRFFIGKTNENNFRNKREHDTGLYQ